MKTQPRLHGLILAASLVLAACGGGGGGGDSPPPAADFQLQAAWRSWVTAGSTTHYTVSGTCTGTATLTDSPAAAATLSGMAVQVVTETLDTAYTNCSPATSTSVSQTYYDSNFLPLATGVGGVVTGKFLTLPTALPSLVKAGDSGTFGTETLYEDETLAVVAGTIVLTYKIEADTDTSLIATLVSKGYDSTGALVVTQQTRWRLGSDDKLVPLAMDVQYSGASTAHLLFTKS